MVIVFLPSGLIIRPWQETVYRRSNGGKSGGLGVKGVKGGVNLVHRGGVDGWC